MKLKLILFICTIFLMYTSIASELKPIETAKGRFKTMNKMGWAIGPEDEYSQSFIEYASKTDGWCLEVGAAYGITSKEAVLNGAKIIINDLDSRHLEFFKNNLLPEYHSNIELKPGNFLEINIKPHSVDAIIASRVLHMLKGEDINIAAKIMHKWLRKGGKVFIIAGTPYQKTWINFISHYEELKNKGVEYPGEIINPGSWNKAQADYLPSFIHLLDIDVLIKIFKKAGFEVEKSGYIDRGDKTQDNIFDDKKESCGLILVKQ